jgi:uncharacterized membrane protein (DUF2068 family)
MSVNDSRPMRGQAESPGQRKRRLDAETEVIRAIATVELIKGLVVLLAGFGALSLIHRDVWDVAVSFLHLLHIKHRYHYADVFLRVAQDVTDRELVLVAVAAALYSTLRFVEAYGLWKKRGWAEWFAAASGALYLPFEINELFRRITILGLGLLVVNLAIVIYMLYLRLVKGDPRVPSPN